MNKILKMIFLALIITSSVFPSSVAEERKISVFKLKNNKRGNIYLEHGLDKYGKDAEPNERVVYGASSYKANLIELSPEIYQLWGNRNYKKNKGSIVFGDGIGVVGKKGGDWIELNGNIWTLFTDRSPNMT